MAQKRSADQTKLIAEAAIAAADKHGWELLTYKDIARGAKCKIADVEAVFPDVWAIIRWHLEHIDAGTRDAVDGYLGDSWRDNLMEILMMRFEFAQAHRAAWQSLPDAFRSHPQKLRRFARLFYKTMDGLLKLSGMPKRLCQPLVVTAFGAVYLSLVHAWLEDETQDLSKTMAAIDKRIGIIETLAEYTACPMEK